VLIWRPLPVHHRGTVTPIENAGMKWFVVDVGLIALRRAVVVNRGEMVDECGVGELLHHIPQAVEFLEQNVVFSGVLFLVLNGCIYFLGPCEDLSVEGVILGEDAGALCCVGGHCGWGGTIMVVKLKIC